MGLLDPFRQHELNLSLRHKVVAQRMRLGPVPARVPPYVRPPKCALLTLLNADLTSMNNAPATFFAAHVCWV